MRPTRPALVACIAVILYLGISLDHLSVFPRVGEDEPWIAAAPYKLATQGVYGSDLFSGYFGVERHNYQQMPLFPLLEAGVFRIFGAGVVQMRALPVFFGFCLLLVVFEVGKRIGGSRTGALAVILMLTLRVAAVENATGIILLDRARVNRYDIAVPVFGLLAFLLFERGERRQAPSSFFWCGVIIGLASLSQLFGVFWLPALATVLLVRRGWQFLGQRAVWMMIAGALCTAVPWLIFVASGWNDYRGQMLSVAPRFDLFRLSFYVSNAIDGDGPISVRWLLRAVPQIPWHRVGSWTALLGIPAALTILLGRKEPTRAGEAGARAFAEPARALALCALLQLVMFAALLKVKTYGYMSALWPLGALCLAWLGIWIWDRYRFAVIRWALAGLLGAIVLQGGSAILHAHQEAVTATPYDFYEAQVARCIPPGSRVLGLQHYWLGLRQFTYRTWLMPLGLANPLDSYQPVSLERALNDVNPDVVLVDRYIAAMLDEAAAPTHPNHRYYTGFKDFAAHRHLEGLCVIRDSTYGTIQVYLVPKQ